MSVPLDESLSTGEASTSVRDWMGRDVSILFGQRLLYDLKDGGV